MRFWRPFYNQQMPPVEIALVVAVVILIVALAVTGVGLARATGRTVACPVCETPVACPGCPDCPECPAPLTGHTTLDGYAFAQGDTGAGEPLTSAANQSPAGLQEMCDNFPGCLGFSTDGVLYDSTDHVRGGPTVTTFSDTGFYGARA